MEILFPDTLHHYTNERRDINHQYIYYLVQKIDYIMDLREIGDTVSDRPCSASSQGISCFYRDMLQINIYGPGMTVSYFFDMHHRSLFEM